MNYYDTRTFYNYENYDILQNVLNKEKLPFDITHQEIVSILNLYKDLICNNEKIPSNFKNHSAKIEKLYIKIIRTLDSYITNQILPTNQNLLLDNLRFNQDQVIINYKALHKQMLDTEHKLQENFRLIINRDLSTDPSTMHTAFNNVLKPSSTTLPFPIIYISLLNIDAHLDSSKILQKRAPMLYQYITAQYNCLQEIKAYRHNLNITFFKDRNRSNILSLSKKYSLTSILTEEIIDFYAPQHDSNTSNSINIQQPIFSERLKNLRKEKHISQEELAKIIGMSSRTIKSLEASKSGTTIRSRTLTDLSKALDCYPDYLLGTVDQTHKFTTDNREMINPLHKCSSEEIIRNRLVNKIATKTATLLKDDLLKIEAYIDSMIRGF